MAYETKKTEHNGSKKGRGAFWGHKADAKKESSRRRRFEDRKVVQIEWNGVDMHISGPNSVKQARLNEKAI